MAGRLKPELKRALKAVLQTEHAISSVCGTRIYDMAIPRVSAKGGATKDYPQITFSIDSNGAALGLPVESFAAQINIWVETHVKEPKTTADRLELAIRDLLHGAVGQTGVTTLNAQSSTLKCRLCRLDSSLELPEPDNNLLRTSMTFTVVLGTT